MVLNAVYTLYYISIGIDYKPYLKHSYADLIGSRSPLLLELLGRFELVGSALIILIA
jgi:hypothetical protein